MAGRPLRRARNNSSGDSSSGSPLTSLRLHLVRGRAALYEDRPADAVFEALNACFFAGRMVERAHQGDGDMSQMEQAAFSDYAEFTQEEIPAELKRLKLR